VLAIMVKSAGVLALAQSVAATKLIFVNQSRVVGPTRHSQLLELDLDSQGSRVLSEQMDPAWMFVDSSVACGSKWYGIATKFPYMGIGVVDMDSGSFDIMKVDGFVHGLKCGNQDNELFTVAGTQENPPAWSLVKVTIDGTVPRMDLVGDFPAVRWGGYSAAFQFGETELQAAFPVKGMFASEAHSGEVYRMDTTSGEITMHKTIKGSPSVPYFIRHTDGETKASGLFSSTEGSSELSLCDIDFSRSEAAVSNCKKDKAGSWWGKGNSPVSCGSDPLFYFPSEGAKTDAFEPILGMDMSSGTNTDAFHLNYHYDPFDDDSEFIVGSLACSTIQTTVV
jgi:hypothetical protein